jgi:hypothetical protein
MNKGDEEKRIGSVVELVGIRLLCDGEREKIQETTGGILPLYQVAWCWCITSYAPTVLGMLARTQADVRKRTQTGDRVLAQQRG